MNNAKTYRININGIVQAVGFRPFVYRIAVRHGLTGWVKNLGDAGVEILVQGEGSDIDEFVADLKNDNPPLARIDEIETEELPGEEKFSEFEIKKSSSGSSGSGTIPPDIATCDDCLDDVLGDSRYHGYWATSCVNCGPRFSVIRELPYDREKTSMDEFPMCEECRSEYTDPLDRRHHAQTIACAECGPELWFETSDGTGKTSDDPIGSTVDKLEQGGVVAIKGLGGSHVACNATEDKIIESLRAKLGRPNQPFALMATKSMVRNHFSFTSDEWESLTGPRRPIVLLKPKIDSWLSEGIAPGLHTAGVMLPYTALHHLLFSRLDFPLVMTSANRPGQPMAIRNDVIREKLSGIVDGYLLHDRKIVSRVDDSVVRYSGGKRKFIRRSRGWVPEPLEVDLGDRPLLALGAEQDNVIGLYKEGKVYLSQHLGDIESPEDEFFLDDALDRLLKLTGSDLPEIVAHDLHPRFITTARAKDLSDRRVPVQHHKAHVGSLLAEHGVSEIVGIVMDGIGLGDNDIIWGGEIITGTENDMERVGALSRAYMPGGDLATRHPARLVAGILYPLVENNPDEDFARTVEELDLNFPEGKEEEAMTVKQLEKGINSPITTSSGRFLDAVSALLGACSERTYEGEPAMKLEALAAEGNAIEVDLPILDSGGITRLDQSRLLRLLVDTLESYPPGDVAATAQWGLAKGLSRIALEVAWDRKIDTIGFSGGVAYNDAISRIIRESVSESGFDFVTNESVPVGDGGVALGQLWVAGKTRQGK